MVRPSHASKHGRAARALAPSILLAACGIHLAACGPGRRAPDTGHRAPEGAAAETAAVTETDIFRPLAGMPAGGADLVLALNEVVDPANAPVAVTHAERVVFANLYETLARMNGNGALRPLLARRWEQAAEGRRWRVDLHENARFWDGTLVTAPIVVQSWRRNATLAAADGRPFADSWLDVIERGLSIVDEHTLQIVLAEPWPGLPHLLAHPDLAVAVERPGWLWPLGSGPCRLSSATGPALPEIVCRPNPHHLDRPSWASLTFRILPGRDARELLDGGVDLAVFRGRREAAYYAQMGGIQIAPLPWDRLYLLLVPPDSELDRHRLEGMSHAPATLSESAPWSSLFLQECLPGSCLPLRHRPAGSPPAAAAPVLPPVERQPRQILFRAADRDARSLADRLAAFLPPGFFTSAADRAHLSDSLDQGQAACYVLRLEAGHPGPCLGLSNLLARARWLRPSAGHDTDPCLTAQRLIDAGLVLPLAATRAHVAWRGPLVGLRLEHDGTPLVAGLGLAPPPPPLP